MNPDVALIVALILIAGMGLPTAFLPLLQEEIKQALFEGSGAVPDDDPVGHDT